MTEILTVSEVYASIQGESSFAGWPCTFVRLTGCPLRCRWCDTAYAFSGGRDVALDSLLREVDQLAPRMVELTGGEPLAQDNTARFASLLLESGYHVLIETGGSESISSLPKETHVVLDVKCPGSGMSERQRWENLDHLKSTDDVKFVIADRQDFDWAVQQTKGRELDHRFQVLFSPAFGLVKPSDLAAWILESSLKVRLQIQQHKYIWSPRKKGV